MAQIGAFGTTHHHPIQQVTEVRHSSWLVGSVRHGAQHAAMSERCALVTNNNSDKQLDQFWTNNVNPVTVATSYDDMSHYHIAIVALTRVVSLSISLATIRRQLPIVSNGKKRLRIGRKFRNDCKK